MLFVIITTPKILPKVPGSLVGVVISTIIATVFFSGHVPTIGTAYGTIPNTLPQFDIPEITLARIEQLIGPAFVIAMLGGIESLLSAVVADGMTNSKHNSNKELIGQGLPILLPRYLAEFRRLEQLLVQRLILKVGLYLRCRVLFMGICVIDTFTVSSICFTYSSC